MNIDIRKSIKENFKDNNEYDIIESVEDAVNDAKEITLPGLGVFFEILWINCNKEEKNQIVSKIKKGL